jgi:hypothetical protein
MMMMICGVDECYSVYEDRNSIGFQEIDKLLTFAAERMSRKPDTDV